jgi:substrate import-associated zinc metallohydrolase lipoprotein
MHHEFAHILSQHKDYDTEFRTISDNDYVTGNWSTIQESDALKAGFIDAYAMSEYNEDFAETLSFYLIYTPEEWNQKMRTAGESGAAIIDRKLTIIRDYMKSAWDIDIDALRNTLQRRINDVVSGKVELDTISNE